MMGFDLTAVGVSGFVKYLKRVAMDGDEDVCEDKVEVGGVLLKLP
jgi:hypothetical protein